MQFRICESQLAQESIDKKLIFLAKLEKCILPSFQKFPKRGIPRFGNFQNEGSLISGILSQRAQRHKTNRFFLEVSLSFLSHFLLLDSLYVHDTDILKRYWSWLAFSGRWEHFYKVPPLHKGHHRQLNK